jgi:hypothetical protein
MRPEVFAQPNSEQIAFSFTIEASNRYPYGNVGHYLTGLRLILSIHSIYGIVREPRGRLTKEFNTERNLRNAHLYRGTSKRIQERTGPHTSRSLTARTFASPKDVGKCIVPNITSVFTPSSVISRVFSVSKSISTPTDILETCSIK